MKEKEIEEKLLQAFDLWFGLGEERNNQKAKVIFEEISKKGNKIAQLFHETVVVPIQKQGQAFGGFMRLVEDFEKKEKEGDLSERETKILSWCLLLVGKLYQAGRGVGRNREKSFEFYRKSAEKGNGEAFLCLGTCYKNGVGVEKNFERAMEYYEKAREKGSIISLNSIGSLYHSGKGVKRDLKKAAELYEKVAKKGDYVSVYNLGLLYKNEEEFRDLDKAAEYFYRSSFMEAKFLKEKGTKILAKLIASKKIEWKPEYHKFWKYSTLLVDRTVLFWKTKKEIRTEEVILTVLLASKYRERSRDTHIKFFVKGIAMNVIKFFAHICQMSEN